MHYKRTDANISEKFLDYSKTQVPTWRESEYNFCPVSTIQVIAPNLHQKHSNKRTYFLTFCKFRKFLKRSVFLAQSRIICLSSIWVISLVTQ